MDINQLEVFLAVAQEKEADGALFWFKNAAVDLDLPGSLVDGIRQGRKKDDLFFLPQFGDRREARGG